MGMGGSDIKAVARKLEQIPRGLDKALTRTANRAAQGGQSDSVKILAGQLNLKQKDIRSMFSIRRATWKRPIAILQAAGSRGVGLEKFSPKPGPTAKKKPQGGLSVKIYRRRSPKMAKGTFWMPVSKGSAKKIVMKRWGKKRGQLERAFGMSSYVLFRRKAILRRANRQIARRIHSELPKQVRGVLAQGGKL